MPSLQARLSRFGIPNQLPAVGWCWSMLCWRGKLRSCLVLFFSASESGRLLSLSPNNTTPTTTTQFNTVPYLGSRAGPLTCVVATTHCHQTPFLTSIRRVKSSPRSDKNTAKCARTFFSSLCRPSAPLSPRLRTSPSILMPSRLHGGVC